MGGTLAVALSAFAIAMPIGAGIAIANDAGGAGIGVEVFWVVVGEVLVALGAWFFWRATLARIEANEVGLIVVNYTHTVRLAWDQIESFEVGGGYFGIAARLRDGHVLTLNAIQKANAATWTGTKTRAVWVVAELNALRAQHA